MEEERRLKLYNYCSRLCGEYRCDNCIYEIEGCADCLLSKMQSGLHEDFDKTFEARAAAKYDTLSNEVSLEEIEIEFQDFQFDYCLDTPCTICPFNVQDKELCALYETRNTLRKRLDKKGNVGFPYTDP